MYLSKKRAKVLARAITVLGVVVALIAIIQRAFPTGRIYGFWVPLDPSAHVFGPFVNRNHFAGWMMMALPVALGLLCAEIWKTAEQRLSIRDRLLWLGSPAGSRIILTGGAAFVMAIALVLTLSRSGVAAFGISALLFATLAVSRIPTASRKGAVIFYLAALILLTISWVGFDTIGERFTGSGSFELEDRWGAWHDAWAVAQAFPLVGSGINTYGLVMTAYQTHNLEWHFSAAHNDYLQVLAEGGLLVMVPALGLLIGLAHTVRRRLRDPGIRGTDWWLRAGASAGLLAIALQEIVDFSLQIPGNAVLFVALTAIAIHRPQPSSRSSRT